MCTAACIQSFRESGRIPYLTEAKLLEKTFKHLHPHNPLDVFPSLKLTLVTPSWFDSLDVGHADFKLKL